MSSTGRVSFGQRVYNRLFRIFGPAQISEADTSQTGLATSTIEQTEQLGQWEKATDGTRTWLVRRQPGQGDPQQGESQQDAPQQGGQQQDGPR